MNLSNKICLPCEEYRQVQLRYINGQIHMLPCCETYPRNNIEPFVWEPYKFVTDFENCLKQYENFDLTNLYNYFGGLLFFNKKKYVYKL